VAAMAASMWESVYSKGSWADQIGMPSRWRESQLADVVDGSAQFMKH
jgi:hypothetical protein